MLEKTDAEAIRSIANLVGEYSMVKEGQLMNMTLAVDGSFSAIFESCGISGEISIESSVMRVDESSNSCTDDTSMGVVHVSSTVVENDTIEILVPNSTLTGHWVE